MPNKSGFTLIELLVVISIIAVLATVGLTIYTNAQKSGRDTKRIADIDAIAQAMEVHYNDQNAFNYTCVLDSYFANGSQAYKDPSTGQSYNLPGCSGANCVTWKDGTQTCSVAVANTNPPAFSSWIACATLEGNKTGNQFDSNGNCNGPNGACMYCKKNTR